MSKRKFLPFHKKTCGDTYHYIIEDKRERMEGSVETIDNFQNFFLPFLKGLFKEKREKRNRKTFPLTWLLFLSILLSPLDECSRASSPLPNFPFHPISSFTTWKLIRLGGNYLPWLQWNTPTTWNFLWKCIDMIFLLFCSKFKLKSLWRLYGKN